VRWVDDAGNLFVGARSGIDVFALTVSPGGQSRFTGIPAKGAFGNDDGETLLSSTRCTACPW
jgi:hypothetical protein